MLNKIKNIVWLFSVLIKSEDALHDELIGRDPLAFGFHGDVIYQKAVLEAIRVLRSSVFVETGTFLGDSTRFIAQTVESSVVFSCEITSFYFKQAKAVLRDYKNVKVLKESSPRFLSNMLTRLRIDEPAVFFLDAHWGKYWPLADELRTITGYPGRFLVIIDDFRSPKSWLHYDVYAGQALDLAYVLKNLNMKNDYAAFSSNYDPEDTNVSVSAGHLFLFQNLRSEFMRLKRCEPISRYYAIEIE